MAHVSGNPTWKDYPALDTLVTALNLENIEAALDLLDAARADSAARPFVRYHCAVAGGQNITADGTPKLVPFDVAVDTHTDVVRSGPMTSFQLNRAGVWRLSAGLRLQATAAAGRQFMIWDGTTSVNRYAEQAVSSSIVTSFNLSTERRFAAGAVVAAGLAILTTGTSDKVATDVPGSTFFTATWIRP